jgi:hypothetical protein
MSDLEPKDSDLSAEENSPEFTVGYCYWGKCDNKGEKVHDFKMTKARCESAGGKSWVHKGTCYEL